MQTKIDKAFRCWQYRLGQVWVPELVESPLSCSEYQTDRHCKIKETLLIQELKPTLNDTVSSEKLYLF